MSAMCLSLPTAIIFALRGVGIKPKTKLYKSIMEITCIGFGSLVGLPFSVSVFDPIKRIPGSKLEEQLNKLINEDHKIKYELIDSKILEDNPELVRTMSVKPPKSNRKIRLVKIGNIDLQPCGGTHVLSTIEIGKITVNKVENKGRMNRRINIKFND